MNPSLLSPWYYDSYDEAKNTIDVYTGKWSKKIVYEKQTE